MLTLLIVFLTLTAFLGITFWIEEGPESFAPPVPLPEKANHRYPNMTAAGYRPQRRKHAVR